ncbi:MAG: hypothetical protein ABSC62_09100 [Terracidiphilus sp.]|jgi:hypothetical protein
MAKKVALAYSEALGTAMIIAGLIASDWKSENEQLKFSEVS